MQRAWKSWPWRLSQVSFAIFLICVQWIRAGKQVHTKQFSVSVLNQFYRFQTTFLIFSALFVYLLMRFIKFYLLFFLSFCDVLMHTH